MTAARRAMVASCSLCVATFAHAGDSPAPPEAAASASDQLLFSADASPRAAGAAGQGGSASWLHAFAGGSVFGVGSEFRKVASAQWTNGMAVASLRLAHAAWKPRLLFDLHEGFGTLAQRPFRYSVVALGFGGDLAPRLSMLVEDRRIDIDTSHGHLPRLTLVAHATPRLDFSGGYAFSTGGNLGTRLLMARVDYLGRRCNALGGITWGPASPAVYDPLRQVIAPGAHLTESYVGLGLVAGPTRWQLGADHQVVGGTRRTMLTLTGSITLSDTGP